MIAYFLPPFFSNSSSLIKEEEKEEEREEEEEEEGKKEGKGTGPVLNLKKAIQFEKRKKELSDGFDKRKEKEREKEEELDPHVLTKVGRLTVFKTILGYGSSGTMVFEGFFFFFFSFFLFSFFFFLFSFLFFLPFSATFSDFLA